VATNNKDFKVKNGLQVSGVAEFHSDVVLGDTQLSFDSNLNRLVIQINGEWVPLATLEDADVFTFEDIGVAVDYDGNATYIVQANGVSPASPFKFADNGTPETSTFPTIFDSGALVV